MLSIGIIAALSSVILWTVSQLISKVIAPRLGTFKTAAIVVPVGVLPMLLLFIISPTVLSAGNISISIASGLALAVGYVLFYKSVESQNISNIGGIDLVQPAVLAIYGVFILSEPINAIQVIGTLIVFLGIALVGKMDNGKFNMKLLPAALGNIAWAFYWIILSSAIAASNQYVLPLLISRFTAAVVTVVVLMFLIETKKENNIKTNNRNAIKFSIAALIILGFIEAIFDSTGNIVFGIVVANNVLAIGAILMALQPALIASGAHFIFRERLTKVQTAGLATAIVGALLIALF